MIHRTSLLKHFYIKSMKFQADFKRVTIASAASHCGRLEHAVGQLSRNVDGLSHLAGVNMPYGMFTQVSRNPFTEIHLVRYQTSRQEGQCGAKCQTDSTPKLPCHHDYSRDN